MQRCAICLDESPSVLEFDIKSCSCIVFVHHECLILWRIQNNKCIICHDTLPPIPIHVRIFYYHSYNDLTIHSLTVKTIYYSMYIFCMYQLFLFSVDVFFYSFLMQFDDIQNGVYI